MKGIVADHSRPTVIRFTYEYLVSRLSCEIDSDRGIQRGSADFGGGAAHRSAAARKTFLDSLKRVRPGKMHIPVLSTELGYGLIILGAAKLKELHQGQSTRVITKEDIKAQFMPLASMSLAQKAFLAMHGLDLLARLDQFSNSEPK
jgi:hypothetical protein